MIDGATITVAGDEAKGSLNLTIDGREVHEDVHFTRAYPFSDADHYVGAFSADGDEIGLIPALTAVEATSRTLIEKDLERRYFTPIIHQISKLKQDATLWLFDVETSRGACSFYVRHWRDSSHELSPGRWMITSVDGVRFEIPDWNKLDERSKTLLEQLN